MKLKMFPLYNLLYNTKLQGSRQMREKPFDFSTITRDFTYSVCSLTDFMMPILVILSCSAFNLFFNAKGIFLEGLITG